MTPIFFHSSRAIDEVVIPFAVTIRPCTREDLPKLEWGPYWSHRQIFQDAFRRHMEGTNCMLVAESDGHVIGQVWADLSQRGSPDAGLVWALRVQDAFQGRGLGARLLASAEQVICEQGLNWAELGVDTADPQPLGFYRKLGYREAGFRVEEVSYETPDGHRVEHTIHQQMMRKRLAGGITRSAAS